MASGSRHRKIRVYSCSFVVSEVMKMRIRLNSKSAIVAMLFFAAVIALRADTITVTNTNDSGPGSLRQALIDANDGDTITFAVTGTIGLTSGELLVNNNITVSGPGPNNLAVDGKAKSRVFHIAPGITFTISGLTVTNGLAFGFFPDNEGAGIYNDHATLTLTNCAISDNVAENEGGGIYNDATAGSASLLISDSALSSNSAEFGGGIYNDARMKGTAATLQISNSTLNNNTAGYAAGAIFSIADIEGTMLTLSNCTISGNSAPAYGGGIYNHATLAISTSTLSDNSAANGASLYNEALVSIGNTVLKAGVLGANIFNNGGTVTSLGYNLSSDDGGGFLTGPGDQINTDPLLGPLQNNGGPTFTHELLPSSPAIDAGNPNFTPPPFFDQRGPGFDRLVNGRLDIGSFEVQSGGPTPTPTPTPSVTPSATPTPTATPRSTPTPRPRPAPHPRPTPR